MPLTAILFDWDLTLVYTLHPQATMQERRLRQFADAQILCTVEQYEAALTEYDADLAARRAQRSVQPQRRQEIVRLYQEILRRIGHQDTSKALAYRLYSSYAELPTFFYDDVPQTLTMLQERGFRLGILSNHSRSVRPLMERMAAAWIPGSRIIISEEVGVHKPAKTIFARARARMGVPRTQVAYIGDNLRVDAIGAVENGGYAAGIWLDRKEQGVAEPLPSHVRRITGLGELAGILMPG